MLITSQHPERDATNINKKSLNNSRRLNELHNKERWDGGSYLFLQDPASPGRRYLRIPPIQRRARLSPPSPAARSGPGSNRKLEVWTDLPNASQDPQRLQHPSENANISPSVFSATRGARRKIRSTNNNNKAMGDLVFPAFVLYFSSFKITKREGL